jgi:outer membrane protein
VRGEVARRYWRAVGTERAILLEEALLASARERLSVTQRLVRVALRGPVDVLGAEVRVAEQEGAVERARGEHRKALLDLQLELGDLGGSPLQLTDVPPAPFDPARLDLERFLHTAVAAHPRVVRANAGASAASQRVRVARAQRFPTVGVSAYVARSQYFSDYSGLHSANPRNSAVALSFDIGYPLFDGHRASSGIERAQAALSGAQADVGAELLEVERDYRAAVIDLQNAWLAAGHSTRTLALNRRRVELAQEQYRAGGLTFAELQDATETAARAERDALSAAIEFALAFATLEERAARSLSLMP